MNKPAIHRHTDAPRKPLSLPAHEKTARAHRAMLTRIPALPTRRKADPPASPRSA